MTLVLGHRSFAIDKLLAYRVYQWQTSDLGHMFVVYTQYPQFIYCLYDSINV